MISLLCLEISKVSLPACRTRSYRPCNQIITQKLKSMLQRLLTHGTRQKQELEKQEWEMHMHNAMGRSRSTWNRLHMALELLGMDISQCEELGNLGQMLNEAAIQKSTLEFLLF
jgi:hypothetical protein